MPKNKGAGGKKRRKGRSGAEKPEMVFREQDQEYGQVIKSVGNGFMEVLCFGDEGNTTRRAHIRGKMRKRAWMGPGDIVLVSTRDFQDNTCDIIAKYNSNEARILRTRGEVPEGTNINEEEEDDDAFVIREDSDDEEYCGQKKKVPDQNRNLDLPPSDSDEDYALDDL